MSRRHEHSRHGRRLVAAVLGLTLLPTAGCGSTPPPSQAVPELSGSLAGVDQAIVDHQPGQARRQLKELIHTTVAARDAGRLDSTQADAVLAAAAGLLSELPRPRPKPDPTVVPAPKPKPTRPAPDKEHKEHKDHEEHEDHGHHWGWGHGEGKGDQGGDSDED